MVETIKWEYRVETIGSAWSGVKDEDMQAALNEWGEEGWEVISLVWPPSSSRVKVIARRPITGRSNRERKWPGVEVA
jgi:hypothetical protein